MATSLRQQVEMRVGLGASWLYLQHPGWHWRLDLDRLDMASVEDDVLGQIVGPPAVVPLSERTIVLYGFDVDDQPDPTPGLDEAILAIDTEVYLLEQAWRALVEQLRDADLAVVAR